MIPDNAEKPSDGRYKGNKKEAEISSPIAIPVKSPLMIMSRLYNKPGNARRCITSLSAIPEVAALYEGELAFIQGDIERAHELLLPLFDVEFDFYGTMNVGMIASVLAMWENDTALWKKSREHINLAVCDNDAELKIKEMWLEITDFISSDKMQENSIFSRTEITGLPEDSLPMYLFYYAKHIHKLGVDLARKEIAYPDINGISETKFAPDNDITGEQIAAIMHRYARYKRYDVSVGENTNILSYDDFDSISEYAIASMQYAVGSGLIKGKSVSTLNPLDNATRAEIAAILHRFIEANK